MTNIVKNYERLLDLTKKHEEAISKILPLLNGFNKKDAEDVLRSVQSRLDDFPIYTID